MTKHAASTHLGAQGRDGGIRMLGTLALSAGARGWGGWVFEQNEKIHHENCG